MQLKKLLQGSAFALVAAACAIAVPSAAKAATGDTLPGDFTSAGIEGVKVDGTKGTMEITVPSKSAPPEVLVGIGKVNAKKGTIAVSTWDSYKPTESKVTVDLSKLSNVKDNYILVSTPSNDVSIVKIKATAKATKAAFDVKESKLQAHSADKVSKSDIKTLDDTTGVLYEFKTAYSNWTDVATAGTKGTTFADMALYQEEGAKLTVRLKGTVDEDALVQSTEEKLTYTKELNVYESLAKLPGKEAKVTIAAKAKGPNAVVDYAKGTIKFPRNNEYRLAKSDAVEEPNADTGKYKTGSTTAVNVATLTPEGSDFAGVEKYDVEVRTIATEKKAASKWSRVTVEAPLDLEKTKAELLTTDTTSGRDADRNALSGKDSGWDTPAEKGEPNKTGGGKGIALAVLKESTDADKSILTITYETVGKLDASKYFTKNAFKIKNDGEKTYEFAVGDKAEDVKKPTKLAKGKEFTFKKVADGAKVWVRVAGDKKNKVWVGKWAQLGVVDYAYEVPSKTE